MNGRGLVFSQMMLFGCDGMERAATVSSLPILVFTFTSPLARLRQYILDCLRTVVLSFSVSFNFIYRN